MAGAGHSRHTAISSTGNYRTVHHGDKTPLMGISRHLGVFSVEFRLLQVQFIEQAEAASGNPVILQSDSTLSWACDDQVGCEG